MSVEILNAKYEKMKENPKEFGMEMGGVAIWAALNFLRKGRHDLAQKVVEDLREFNRARRR